MSYDILSQPTQPNVTQTDLVYVLSSSNAGQPQFRYVVDFETSDGLFGEFYGGRIKAYPNVYGQGVVRVDRGVNDSLSPLFNGLPKPNGPFGLAKVEKFNLTFGEEYATSLDAIPFYTASGPVIEDFFILPGYKNINDDPEDGYNKNLTPYDPIQVPGSEVLVSTDNTLSIYPYPYPPTPTNPKKFEVGLNTPWMMTIWRPDNTGWKIMNVTISGFKGNTFITSQARSFDFTGFPGWSRVQLHLTLNEFSTIKASVEAGDIDWVVYTVSAVPFSDNFTKFYQALTATIKPECEIDTQSTFTWRNSFGLYDFYHVFNPVRRVSNIERNTYDRTFVRYEDCDSGYNISNRGRRQYMTNYDDTYEVTTDWLTEEQAKYVSRMFESDIVGYYTPDLPFFPTYTPIIIVDNTYEVNNSTSRNKLFQYTIKFKYGLQRQPR